MPIIERLEVYEIRNLRTVALDLHPGLNLLAGANGSGKTSVLEAAHLLSYGRSFRTLKTRRLVNDAAARCVVTASLIDDSDNRHRIGLQKTVEGEALLRINGEDQPSIASAAALLPVLVLHPDAVEFFAEGPKARRQFLDWGVFHVEHEFYPQWIRCQQLLKQRNSLLRDGRIPPLALGQQLQAWTQQLDQAAGRLHQFREQYFETGLKPAILHQLQFLLPEMAIDVEYFRGWDKQQSLAEVLAGQQEAELKQGYTLSGPHRADVRLKLGNQLAFEVLSRGQLKLLVAALRLAQAEALLQQTGNKTVLLIDDLPAELDAMARARLSQSLLASACQVLMTAVDNSWTKELLAADQYHMFHVEHGNTRLAGL